MKKVNKNGFTLVETILAVAILCIIIAVVAIVVTGYLDKASTANDEASKVAPTLTNMFQNKVNKA